MVQQITLMAPCPTFFFRESIAGLVPGKILFPAEGEGRNAVYAAKQGWEVTAFDSSVNAKNKALNFAQTSRVRLHYDVVDAFDTDYPDAYFDCLVFVFVHLPESLRRKFHQRMLQSLKPGGTVIFEGFAKKQIELDTGGPRNVDMLFSADDIIGDFQGQIHPLVVEEKEIELNEGRFHLGKAHVIRFRGTKTKIHENR